MCPHAAHPDWAPEVVAQEVVRRSVEEEYSLFLRAVGTCDDINAVMPGIVDTLLQAWRPVFVLF